MPATSGDDGKAKAAADGMLRAYDPCTAGELALGGWIAGSTMALLDRLRRTMTDPDVSATHAIRFQPGAVPFSRHADQFRAELKRLQPDHAAGASACRCETGRTTTISTVHGGCRRLSQG